MSEPVRARTESPAPRRSEPPASSPSPAASLHARAVALQRMAGNRAATRVLARWVAHPDKEKKGTLMADTAAAEFNRLNPPLSK